jgi:hypothetical protein
MAYNPTFAMLSSVKPYFSIASKVSDASRITREHKPPESNKSVLQNFPEFLRRARCSAPTTAHQVNIRARLKQGIGGRFDAIHSGNGIKDDVLLLAGIV